MTDRDDEVSRLRVPPHSTEAEQSVLGSLLTDNRAWDLVGDMMAEGDFYASQHRVIFTAIASLCAANRPADVITVHQRLQELGKDREAGGLVHLNALAQSVPSAANIRRYAEIVRERAVLRRLIATSDEIATSAFNTQGLSVDAILDQAGAKLSAVLENGGERDEWAQMDALVLQQMDRVQADYDNQGAAVDYIPTGLSELDDMLDGGAGVDTLVGGVGDDEYYVDDSTDVIVEQAGEGHESVHAGVSYVLSANVEDLFLDGSASINGTGNVENNVLLGNSGNNVLDGGVG